MHLHDQLCVGLLFFQPVIDVDHCKLDDVRGRALHGHIHCNALTEGLQHLVAGRQLRKIPSASEQRFCIAVFPRVGDLLLHEVCNTAVMVQIVFDIIVGLLARHADVLGKRKCADAVNDAEIDRFGPRTQKGSDHLNRQSEHLRCGDGVDIVAAFKCAAHGLVV